MYSAIVAHDEWGATHCLSTHHQHQQHPQHQQQPQGQINDGVLLCNLLHVAVWQLLTHQQHPQLQPPTSGALQEKYSTVVYVGYLSSWLHGRMWHSIACVSQAAAQAWAQLEASCYQL
jgi:hypothetical protein